MYPELESPASPLDQPMTEPKTFTIITTTLVPASSPPPGTTPTDTQLKSSSDTLKNNIDLKDQSNKKRTSLNIENTAASPPLAEDVAGDVDKKITRDDNATDMVVHQMRSPVNNNEVQSSDYEDNNQHATTTTTTSLSSDPIDNNRYHRCDDDNESDERRRRQRKSVKETDDDEADYNDLEETDGGNSTDSTRKRDSITSDDDEEEGGKSVGESSDDYFLCEKFKNTLNENLQNALNDSAGRQAALELLSPHEGPLGRRYAEIAHFKNGTGAAADMMQATTTIINR